jgi:uncharacterized membrane protein
MEKKPSIKRYLITGLLVWVPLAITVWVLSLILGTLDRVAALIPFWARPDYWLIQTLAPYFPSIEMNRTIPGFGILMALAVLLGTGLFAANILGQRLIYFWESILTRIPIVRSIYTSVKQVSDTLFSGSGQAFRQALLVRFPHENAWTIGFLTGTPGGEVACHLPGEYISVYVPTTPNPTSGYFIIVAKASVIELNISVDEALKYVISMGVVSPIESDYTLTPINFKP